MATPFTMTDFERTSVPEFLTPAFDSNGGQTTVKSYSGYVEIFVSEAGLNNIHNPNLQSDGFYDYAVDTNTELYLMDNPK